MEIDSTSTPTEESQKWRWEMKNAIRSENIERLLREIEKKRVAPFHAAFNAENTIWKRAADENDYHRQIHDLFCTLELFPEAQQKSPLQTLTNQSIDEGETGGSFKSSAMEVEPMHIVQSEQFNQQQSVVNALSVPVQSTGIIHQKQRSLKKKYNSELLPLLGELEALLKDNQVDYPQYMIMNMKNSSTDLVNLAVLLNEKAPQKLRVKLHTFETSWLKTADFAKKAIDKANNYRSHNKKND